MAALLQEVPQAPLVTKVVNTDVVRYLRPGATEEQLSAAEAELGVQLPAALRALYRVCDGQVTRHALAHFCLWCRGTWSQAHLTVG